MTTKKKSSKKRTKYCHTQEQYCKDYGVSRSTIQRWQASGAPLDDPEGMKAFVAKQRSTPASMVPADLKEAQMKKVLLECDRLTFRINTDKGDYIPKAEVIADGIAIGNAFASALDKLRADLPPILLGLDEAGISAAVERETNKIRADVAKKIKGMNGDMP